MKLRLFLTLLLPLLAAGCATRTDSSRPLRLIAFGSCINTNRHPMLEAALKVPFDLFILLGDNIYADTTNMTVMAHKYDALQQSEFFKGLRKKAPLLATWDDHDFGKNDVGAEYLMKSKSQQLFLDFMDEPGGSPRRTRPGVYHAKVFGPTGQQVQVIMLDTRYFRSMLTTGENNVVPSGGKYVPNNDPNATILGEDQWKWFEEQLRVPAEVRVIASSIQFISEFSGAEAWSNFPREKQRMLRLLADTKATGVLFISGDRHWAELSRLDRPGTYPIYDLTSSALTQKHARGTPTPNIHRVGPTYHDANLGLIHIDWKREGPSVELQLIDSSGGVRIQQVVK